MCFQSGLVIYYCSVNIETRRAHWAKKGSLLHDDYVNMRHIQDSKYVHVT